MVESIKLLNYKLVYMRAHSIPNSLEPMVICDCSLGRISTGVVHPWSGRRPRLWPPVTGELCLVRKRQMSGHSRPNPKPAKSFYRQER